MSNVLAVLIMVVVRRDEELGQDVECAVASRNVDSLDLDIVDTDGGLDGTCTLACVLTSDGMCNRMLGGEGRAMR